MFAAGSPGEGVGPEESIHTAEMNTKRPALSNAPPNMAAPMFTAPRLSFSRLVSAAVSSSHRLFLSIVNVHLLNNGCVPELTCLDTKHTRTSLTYKQKRPRNIDQNREQQRVPRWSGSGKKRAFFWFRKICER